MKLALFDLDHTLLPLDSDYAWGCYTSSLGWNDAAEFTRRNEAFFAQYRDGTLDIHDYVRFATESIRRHGPQKSEAAHQRFMQEVIEKAIQPQALALVRSHQQAGDEVIIVTATNEFVTRPIAKAFGVAELMAIDLERETRPDGSNWYTGEIRGVPSFREGKVERVGQWLAERQLGWADVQSTFYSDSINDLAMLEIVNHPVATNPDDRLRAIALQRGWRILELF
jgi:HAD superfamily hydrolase (TIGR01490 family)